MWNQAIGLLLHRDGLIAGPEPGEYPSFLNTNRGGAGPDDSFNQECGRAGCLYICIFTTNGSNIVWMLFTSDQLLRSITLSIPKHNELLCCDCSCCETYSSYARRSLLGIKNAIIFCTLLEGHKTADYLGSSDLSEIACFEGPTGR